MKGLNCKTIVKACFPHFMCFTFLVDTLTGSDPDRSVTTSRHIQWRKIVPYLLCMTDFFFITISCDNDNNSIWNFSILYNYRSQFTIYKAAAICFNLFEKNTLLLGRCLSHSRLLRVNGRGPQFFAAVLLGSNSPLSHARLSRSVWLANFFSLLLFLLSVSKANCPIWPESSQTRWQWINGEPLSLGSLHAAMPIDKLTQVLHIKMFKKTYESAQKVLFLSLTMLRIQ